jgi:hypothetical protein
VWIQWISKLVGIQKKTVSEPKKASSPNEKYIESIKTKFLQTFQTGEEDWNSNIEDVIKDKEKLAELLKTPNNELEKKWKTRILIETTPRGNVIVFYDLYKSAFSYYCDQAIMPYELMNAVAMKYVLTFHCRDFFVDSSILPAAKPVVLSNEKREETPNVTTVAKLDTQAFAKFKTYNNATKKAGISAENDKVINCFLYLGASRNWSPILKKGKVNPINGFKTDLVPGSNNKNKMSYLEYKNRYKKD